LLRSIPEDRLLLETDAPFLVPRNLPGVKKSARNEPKYLPHIAAFVAAARGVSPAALSAAAVANTRRFMGTA
jgi:TatD DNase family protein